MRADRIASLVMKGALALFIAVWVMVAVIVGRGAWRFVSANGLVGPLLSSRWSPLTAHYGIMAFVVGSMAVTGLALVLAAPGVLALSVTGARILRGAPQRAFIQILTLFVAVPSVVYGWWGLSVAVPLIRRLTGTAGFGPLSAGIVLAVMIAPTFSIMALQTLRQVPSSLVEGSLGLGATEDQTLWHVILPASRAGLSQGFLVAVGRALGETIAVQMVIGGQSRVLSLLKPGATLTTQLLTDLALMPARTPGHDALDFMALWLMILMAVLVWLQSRVRGMSRG